MKKTLIAAVVAVCFSFTFVFNAHALEPLQINPGVLQGILNALKQARCDKVKANQPNKLDKIEKIRNKHQTAYDNLVSRLNALVAKLEARGYSVGDIKAEISVLKDKINTFGDDYQKFFDLMGEVKAQACGSQTDAQVKTKLGEAQAQLKVVRKDAKAVRDYYFTVIRPDIQALKNQTPAN